MTHAAWRLVADIGGTNARFGRIAGGALVDAKTLLVRDFASFEDALTAYLGTSGTAGCKGAAIGVAGPVDGGRARLTNAAWVIEAEAIGAILGAEAFLLNDLEAAALLLPRLKPQEMRFIGGPSQLAPSPRRLLAVNIGTGFGAAVAFEREGRWLTSPSEAGHMAFAAADAEELALTQGRGDLAYEDFLSGRGLACLHRRCGGQASTATETLAAAGTGEPAALNALRLANALIARLSGDLALASAAWDGVFFFGSVAQGWAGFVDEAAFRCIFENKGAMAKRMRSIPTALVLKPDAALHGLASLFGETA